MRTISPDSFNFEESVLLFTIVILCGSGNQRGVIAGAFLVMGLPEFFRGFQDKRLLVFGAALVLMMIFRPQGLFPPKSAKFKLSEKWMGRLAAAGNGSGGASGLNGARGSGSQGGKDPGGGGPSGAGGPGGSAGPEGPSGPNGPGGSGGAGGPSGQGAFSAAPEAGS
jgi:hypothetical protein